MASRMNAGSQNIFIGNVGIFFHGFANASLKLLQYLHATLYAKQADMKIQFGLSLWRSWFTNLLPT